MSSIDSFALEITKALKTYTAEVEEGLEKAKVKVATKAVKKLKERSPVRTGAYAAGWRRKKVGTAQVIHNATHYQLAHLLEKGHAKRGGGRVAARVHIKPVEQEAIKDFETQVVKAIKQ
jgi:hypothetical protein